MPIIENNQYRPKYSVIGACLVNLSMWYVLTLLLFRLLLLLLILFEIFIMVLTLMRMKSKNANGENPLFTLTGGHFCFADRMARFAASSSSSDSTVSGRETPCIMVTKVVEFSSPIHIALC